jgi:hypothetical protein
MIIVGYENAQTTLLLELCQSVPRGQHAGNFILTGLPRQHGHAIN